MQYFIKFILPLLACAFAAVARAEENTVVSGPLTRENFVSAVSGNFVSHFNLEGELRLELLRSWSAPARVAREWTIDMAEYPLVLAPAMLARRPRLADGPGGG